MALSTDDRSERPTVIVDLPDPDRPFHVEQHGIDFIPETERWARPKDLFGMWAGASIQIEYFIYGAILMTFGFTFAQALSLIVLGNLSFFLLGLCSLQGPDAGTTVFGTNRAAYGPNGSRVIAAFNWITQIGFEVEGLILIVFAALALSLKAGLDPGNPAKVALVIAAVGIQFVLPFLGHATMVKVLRWLILPFLILFVVTAVFAAQHAELHAIPHGASWQVYMAGLAFTIALSGLGWTECGNDYSRYLPRESSKSAIVGWVFLGTAIPQILIMTLGAAVATFLGNVGVNASGIKNPFAPLLDQSFIPAWFVVVFLLFAILQLFAINSLDQYSSGVTLQAVGMRVKRYQAVAIDSVVCLVVTLYAVLHSSFSTYLKDFVAVVIVWIAPWVAVYLVDWVLRRYRYVPGELQKTGPDGLYYGRRGVSWPALVAQLLGMCAAMAGLNPTFNVPGWANPVAAATGTDSFTRADFSIFMGMAVAGVVYWLLARRGAARQADLQDRLLDSTGRSEPARGR
ncbi:MAG: purine-cytosine permease family protein [Acidimicrobiales bacterium]